MGLKCGIIGLPNVGKSTLFNALTCSSQAEAGNYPFCTIEPNHGQNIVPDARLDQIASIIQPKKIVPTTLEFTDIAGLVEGASKGEGLGNQFLSHIRETQSLLHIVRSFEDEQITSVYKDVNPRRDVEVINTELLLSDLEQAEKRLKKIEKTSQISKDKALQAETSAMKQAVEALREGKALNQVTWEDQDMPWLKRMNFISLKPCLYVCNRKESELQTPSPALEAYFKEICQEQEEVITLSCSLEAEISLLPKEEKQEFLLELGLKESGLDKVIRKTYKQLNLITFFTAGEEEVRAWTLPKGSLAPQAAGVIHSDFEKGFIRADVYSYQDLLQHKSEKELKKQGTRSFRRQSL